MNACGYVYCGTLYDPARGDCPRCGFPADTSHIRDPAWIEAALPALHVAAPVDMHQILPARAGMLELQLRLMERIGIRRALLQAAPPEAASLSGNERLLEVADSHPGVFWISQYVDPLSTQAIGELQRCAGHGIRVVKLLPCAGYSPDDPTLDAFWQAMEDLRLVAMAHTGFITARHKAEEQAARRFLSSKYGQPVLFDRTARKFPRLVIILCHLGDGLWYEQAAQMVTHHENVWGDVSGFGLSALRRILRNQVAIDWRKVFWGNDSPAYAYPFSLRLLLAALEDGGARDLAPLLLRDNAGTFAARFLE